MAITGTLFNTLTFGGVNSGDYGIYISGEGVFNAPVRAVEMISVPGRNGDLAIDLGHYENITVTYPAGIYGDDGVDFRERLSEFRNAILSQKGYQRLEDSYHPDEFRLGIYTEGLEVAPVHYNEAGQFDLVFNCKPQRFLFEGETEITVTNGEPILNPTLYSSGFLLVSNGYGNIRVNNEYEITIENAVVGEINIPYTPASASYAIFDLAGLNDGDGFFADKVYTFLLYYGFSYSDFRIVDADGCQITFDSTSATINVNAAKADFHKGENSTLEYTYHPIISFKNNSGATLRFSPTIRITTIFTNNYEDGLSMIDFERSIEPEGESPKSTTVGAFPLKIVGNSTISILDNLHIDTEIGVAYQKDGDQVIDLNKYIDLGSNLPKLRPGENIITIDNTFTDLKITPRWWKL